MDKRRNKRSSGGADKRGAVVNHNYSARTYKTEGYKDFADFYPFYLGEHCNKVNRRLHLVATSMSFVILFFGLVTATYSILPLAVIQGYAFAWIGHFFFEKNKPATFKHPFYSFMGDMRLWFEVVTGSRSF